MEENRDDKSSVKIEEREKGEGRRGRERLSRQPNTPVSTRFGGDTRTTHTTCNSALAYRINEVMTTSSRNANDAHSASQNTWSSAASSGGKITASSALSQAGPPNSTAEERERESESKHHPSHSVAESTQQRAFPSTLSAYRCHHSVALAVRCGGLLIFVLSCCCCCCFLLLFCCCCCCFC